MLSVNWSIKLLSPDNVSTMFLENVFSHLILHCLTCLFLEVILSPTVAARIVPVMYVRPLNHSCEYSSHRANWFTHKHTRARTRGHTQLRARRKLDWLLFRSSKVRGFLFFFYLVTLQRNFWLLSYWVLCWAALHVLWEKAYGIVKGWHRERDASSRQQRTRPRGGHMSSAACMYERKPGVAIFEYVTRRGVLSSCAFVAPKTLKRS